MLEPDELDQLEHVVGRSQARELLGCLAHPDTSQCGARRRVLDTDVLLEATRGIQHQPQQTRHLDALPDPPPTMSSTARDPPRLEADTHETFGREGE